jgi:hypothetical protein
MCSKSGPAVLLSQDACRSPLCSAILQSSCLQLCKHANRLACAYTLLLVQCTSDAACCVHTSLLSHAEQAQAVAKLASAQLLTESAILSNPATATKGVKLLHSSSARKQHTQSRSRMPHTNCISAGAAYILASRCRSKSQQSGPLHCAPCRSNACAAHAGAVTHTQRGCHLLQPKPPLRPIHPQTPCLPIRSCMHVVMDM